MKCFYFYHRDTGVLHSNSVVISAPEEEEVAALNCPAEHELIEGNFDPLSQRVDLESGKVVDYQPPAPSADHAWNAETKRWHLSAAAAERLSRSNSARARIAQLENSQHRHVREHLLGMPGAAEMLRAIDDEIFSLRSQLQ